MRRRQWARTRGGCGGPRPSPTGRSGRSAPSPRAPCARARPWPESPPSARASSPASPSVIYYIILYYTISRSGTVCPALFLSTLPSSTLDGCADFQKEKTNLEDFPETRAQKTRDFSAPELSRREVKGIAWHPFVCVKGSAKVSVKYAEDDSTG